MAKPTGTRPTRIKSIEKGTNRSWDEWLTFMAGIGAADLSHAEIAAAVATELQGRIDNPGWWSQGVTVAYEQFTGRRVPGQRSDGKFEFNVSRSSKLDMHALMESWVAFAAQDAQLHGLMGGESRSSGTDRRLNWRAKARDGSNIIVSSEPKANGTASLVATQTGLESLELNEEARAVWRAILDRFAAAALG